jgi:hypothetical protein
LVNTSLTAHRNAEAGMGSSAAPADAIEPATAHALEQGAAKDMDFLRLIDDRSTAQVVFIGEGKFGVIWNGELRPEKYPTKEIAYLAITALRRHESPPTAPVDET